MQLNSVCYLSLYNGWMVARRKGHLAKKEIKTGMLKKRSNSLKPTEFGVNRLSSPD